MFEIPYEGPRLTNIVYGTGRDAARIKELEAQVAAQSELIDMYQGGYKGGCYACETVGEKNVELEAQVVELKAQVVALQERILSNSIAYGWLVGSEGRTDGN